VNNNCQKNKYNFGGTEKIKISLGFNEPAVAV
jgi:hypothetical protein